MLKICPALQWVVLILKFKLTYEVPNNKLALLTMIHYWPNLIAIWYPSVTCTRDSTHQVKSILRVKENSSLFELEWFLS